MSNLDFRVLEQEHKSRCNYLKHRTSTYQYHTMQHTQSHTNCKAVVNLSHQDQVMININADNHSFPAINVPLTTVLLFLNFPAVRTCLFMFFDIIFPHLLAA
jgi:hypothetical protein